MTLALAEKVLSVSNESEVKPELKPYLDTYLKQYNAMVETFDWFKPKLDGQRRAEWERTIASLKKICMALDAGFEPKEPPRNWASGQLIQYLAPIPEEVRKAISKAEPIFENNQILIYDPNTEHFARPRNYDPMAFGFINLANQRHHFLIGAWDLDKDLKFINVPRKRASLNISAKNIQDTLTEIRRINPDIVTQPYTSAEWKYIPNTITSDTITINSLDLDKYTSAPSKWSMYMTGQSDSFVESK